MRMCVGCREMKPKNELIRIVRTPEGEIKVDKSGRLNGRGAYICNDKTCLEKAIKANSISHTFNTSLPAELNEQLRGEFQNSDK